MRNTDDQLREIMKRADHVIERKDAQKTAISYAVSSFACFVLMIVTSLYIPGISSSGAVETHEQYGSLLMNTAYMGFVVIGVLAFILGVFVTLLCMQIRKIRKGESDRY